MDTTYFRRWREFMQNLNQSILYYEFAREESQGFQIHQDIELIYLLKGKMEVEVVDKTYQLQAEDVLMINTMNKHQIRKTNHALYVKLYIRYGGLCRLLNSRNFYFLCNSVVEINNNYESLRKLIIKLLNEHFIEQDYKEVYLNKIYYEIVIFLLNEFQIKRNELQLLDKDASEKRVTDILEYIEIHYQQNITLNDLAKEFYLTPQYLAKYFREKTGTTFLKYLNQIRLKAAIKDLKNTNQTILKVALDNGFPNVASFSRVFYENYKIKPMVFRNQYKKDTLYLNIDSKKIDKEVQSLLKENEDNNEEELRSNITLIEIDAWQKQAYKTFWKEMIDVGNAEFLSKSDVQNQIAILKNELGFEYAKIVLDNTIDFDKNIKFDYFKIERVFDFLLEKNFKLHIVINYRNIRFNEEFHAYLDKLLSHFANRYSITNVQNWRFELFYDSDFEDEKAILYFEEYKKISAIINKYKIRKNLMGPGIFLSYEGDNLQRYLERMKKSKISYDTLTLSAYPYRYGKVDEKIMLHRVSNHQYLNNQYALAKSIMKSQGVDFENIYFTEWKESLMQNDRMNDSCYKGAVILKNILSCFDEANVLCYSNPLDIMIDSKNNHSVVSGLSGMLTKQGIKKPAFYAYYFLNRLGKYLLKKEEHFLVTATDTKNYSIVCHNCKKLNYKYYTSQEQEVLSTSFNELFEDNDKLILQFQLNNVDNGNYYIKERSIHQNAGSVQDTWIQMTDTEEINIGLSEVEYLKSMSAPSIRVHHAQVTDGTLLLEYQLEPNEIKHIHIIYQY